MSAGSHIGVKNMTTIPSDVRMSSMCGMILDMMDVMDMIFMVIYECDEWLGGVIVTGKQIGRAHV